MQEDEKPRFCSDYGMSLVNPGVACTSRYCEECGQEIFYVRRSENGGIRIEKGENFHLPKITMSLDPSYKSYFFRPGLEAFLKQLFLEKKIDPEEIVDRFKEQEAAIDNELSGLDCIQHCDLETNEGVEEAAKILEAEGLMTYWYNLARSACLRKCYEAIENGEIIKAVHSCHSANIFKEYSLLEDEHLKEILWIGYVTYCDLFKNQDTTMEAAKEMQLIKALGPKIKSLDNQWIYSLISDGMDIGKRIGVSGIAEQALKSLLEHELSERNKRDEALLKERELQVQEKSNKIKLWGFLFTLVNAMILAWYKDWLG
ncbi:MAG: hypothetical protein LV471_06815 [Nitrosomonas sp.]|nr:hypothetical protein [Nitrosomonas sp.]